MSVATVAADPASNVAAARADRQTVKAADENATGFKNFVRDDAARDTTGPRKAEPTRGNGGKYRDDAEAEGVQGIWQRFGALFERAASESAQEAPAVDPDAAVAHDSEMDKESAEIHSEVGVAIAQSSVESESPPETAAGRVTAEQSIAAEAGADSPADAIAATMAKEAPAGVHAAASVTASAQIGRHAERRSDPQLGATSLASHQAAAEPEQDAAQKPALTAMPEEHNGGDADAGQDDGRGRERGGQNAAQLAGGGRVAGVSVISQQTAPAPVVQVQPAAMSDTGSAFATSLASGMQAAERSEAAALGGMTRPGAAAPITTLRIQLNPAELGMVTARLSGGDAQISIEITVDNAEARQRLAADSDSIVTALRGMGIEVDRITVQQSQSGSGTMGSSGGRGSEFGPSGESGGRQQDQTPRQGSERGNGDNPQGGRNGANTDPAGGGVYI